MAVPALRQFNTEQELTDFADQLNEAGVQPEIPIMDSAGFSMLACLQAPGGDGWAFAYYGVNDPDCGYIVGARDGGWVEPARHIGEGRGGRGWNPAWPVFGIVTDLT